MPNLCEGCPRSCCDRFSISWEITEPDKVRQMLKQFPFIRRKDYGVIKYHGVEVMVGIYVCDRFKNGVCQDYFTRKRPPFCENTGVTNRPHPDCLIFK